MKQEEYFKTIVANGKMINIGKDDYGQCYFIEYVDDDGLLKEESCGTYNFDYIDYIQNRFEEKKFASTCRHCDFKITNYDIPNNLVNFVCPILQKCYEDFDQSCQADKEYLNNTYPTIKTKNEDEI